MELKQVPIGHLKPHPLNPRIHPDSAIDKLVRSIDEFGWTNPILLSEDGYILAGHARLKAAIKAGLKTVPAIFLPLSGKQAEMYMLADNRLQDETDWDMPALADILAGFEDSGLDATLAGFDKLELAEIINRLKPKEGLTDDDTVPEPTESICRRGDLWQLGNHRLLCGDATVITDVERLMGGEKADMVFTDPPYGIDYSGGRTQVVSKKQYGKMEGDAKPDISEFVNSIIGIAGNKDYYVCLSPINCKDVLPLFPDLEGIIVWKKPQPGLGYQWIRRYCEFIIFGTQRQKGKSNASEFDFWEIETDPKQDYQHGTQKPVALSQRAIHFSSVRSDIVADPFGGSGSTLIACEKLERRCFMMEIDKHYCDVIIKRWEDYTGKKAVKLD